MNASVKLCDEQVHSYCQPPSPDNTNTTTFVHATRVRSLPSISCILHPPIRQECPQAWARGHLPPSAPPLKCCKALFVLQMLSKFLVDDVFMRYFKKMSSAFPPNRPPHCPPLEKIPRAPIQGGYVLSVISLFVCLSVRLLATSLKTADRIFMKLSPPEMCLST